MRTAQRLYSSSDDAFLRTNYLSMSSRVLASHLGRSERSVGDRLQKLGLRRYKTIGFSATEDEVIRAGFRSTTSVSIAEKLGRAPAVVRARARRLGLGEWQGPPKDFREYKVSQIKPLGGGKYRRIPEHRHILEQHLGRSLSGDERVHHINGKKRDNRLENLFLCASDSAHSRAHHSLTAILPDLLERGIIHFDRASGVYRLCETGN